MDRIEGVDSNPEHDIEGYRVTVPMRIRTETPSGEPVILEHDSEMTFSREDYESLNRARANAGVEPVTEQEYIDSVLENLDRMNDSVKGPKPKPERKPSLLSLLVDLLPEKHDAIRVVRLDSDDLDKTPAEIAASLDR